MTALFLDPHGDDLTLFAAFSLLRHRPVAKVVCVLRSQVQEDRGTGITAAAREQETADALKVLGIDGYEQWQQPDSNPDWVAIQRLMEETRDQLRPTLVFAPEFEVNGHAQHSQIAMLADTVFGKGNVTHYLTYERGSARSDWGREVVPEPEWIALKHRALACFASQIREPSTRPWFMDGLREWVA